MAAVIGTVYALDRLSKHIVMMTMSEGESFPVLEGIFHITLVHNTGGAFGIMKGHPYIFTAAAVTFAVFAALYIAVRWFALTFRDRTAVCLVIGGTLGNLSDRIRLGYVVDLFDLRIWPVFNVADSCISIGAAILVFSLLFSASGRDKGCTE